MQASKLPIEVCERVIDSLAISVHNPTLDDYFFAVRSNPTLYACALVCRDWAYRSQHHLFRQVILCTTHQADAFLDVLTRHPHRAKSVQYLEIWPHPPPPPSPPPKTASLPPSPSDSPASSLVLTLPSDSPVPPASPVTAPSSPHSLQMSPISGQTSPQSDSGDTSHPSTPVSSESNIPLRDQAQNKVEEISIPPCYYNWIYKLLIRLPPLLDNLSTLAFSGLPTLHPRFIRLISCFKTVKALHLWALKAQSLSEIIQLINRLPQLTFLDIDNLKWERPARFFASHRLRLEHLICDLTSDGTRADVLDWLGSLQHLSGLRSLKIFSLNRSDTNKLYHILHQCTHSLRYLHLSPDDVDIFESLSLSNHSKLEYLNIWITSYPVDHAALFSSCISRFLSPSLVRLHIGWFENLDPGFFAASQSSWKAVDDALGDPKSNRLTYFVMQLRPKRRHEDIEETLNRETLRATFRKIFPKTYQQGILWVAKWMGNSRQKAFHICEDDDDHDFNVVELSNSYFRM